MSESESFETTYSNVNAGVYRVFFRHVEHENSLSAKRFSLMAQIQSLLLIAYANTFGGLATCYAPGNWSAQNSDIAFGIHLFQLLLPVIGIASAEVARRSINAAHTAFEAYLQEYRGLLGVRPQLAQWPPLAGAGSNLTVASRCVGDWFLEQFGLFAVPFAHGLDGRT